jgi:2TM domain
MTMADRLVAKGGGRMPEALHERTQAVVVDDRGETETPEESTTRQQAIKQIERRRRFHIELVVAAVGIAILVLIWATSEYHNAGGWPTQGFSQSSGIHDVWNYWIVYPIGAIALILGARAWSVYGHKPITEHDISREMERQAPKS